MFSKYIQVEMFIFSPHKFATESMVTKIGKNYRFFKFTFFELFLKSCTELNGFMFSKR